MKIAGLLAMFIALLVAPIAGAYSCRYDDIPIVHNDAGDAEIEAKRERESKMNCVDC